MTDPSLPRAGDFTPHGRHVLASGDPSDGRGEGRAPDFLVIGAQKSGTTWLFNNLCGHPELWLPPVKELNYLNQKFRPSVEGWEWKYRRRTAGEFQQFLDTNPEPADAILRQRRRSRQAALTACAQQELDEKGYLAVFAHADPGTVCGEASPEYCALPSKAIDHIVSLNPGVRAIFLLRDPVSRAVSHIRMLHAYGEIGNPADGVDAMYIEGAVARSDYGPMIKRWQSRLANGSLYLAAYEEIAEDSGRILAGICSFLGVAPDVSLFPDRADVVFRGQGFQVHQQVLRTLEARLSHVYSDVRRVAPEIASRWGWAQGAARRRAGPA